jgi:hypothetical protein
VPDSHLF